MTDFQTSKSLILNFYDKLDKATGDGIHKVLAAYTTDNYHWRGMHPFYEQQGATAVANIFWQPFRQAFAPIQRRQDVFMAGLNQEDGEQTEWVCSMGHLMGLFDQDWLDIPATGKMAFLRYVEFNRVTDGKISETALFCDVISVIYQAGLNPLPPQTGAFFITPGPRTHDGLLFDPQDPSETLKTRNLISQMVDDLTTADLHSDQEELASTWHDDMIWFGPAGIGATYTLERYEAQHQGPFYEGLTDIKFHGHICYMTEGKYGGFFGWANLSMKASGGFMGMPASDVRAEMRVVDIYRRDGDKLAENWIFIDLLHFLRMQGLDVLGRMKELNRRS
ncbi:nuclear transport factor 2 family protein [Candidatus Leptofilum sp.]|uniref:nuclear transport factor 2 family protein n=1 Tax=Candidatus Leptofilum sp. TaxID=3241576 RepID=UPI003B5B09CC